MSVLARRLVTRAARSSRVTTGFRLASDKSAVPCEEITVPVPWGTIAGKVWGVGSRPILALHGWLDNAGSFDGIAPLLPLMAEDQFRLVAIDLPGHGWSSHLPPGTSYSMTDGISTLKRVQDHLQLDRAVLMGHSMGAGVCMYYASVFPERVDRLAVFDIIGLPPVPVKKQHKSLRKSIEQSIAIHEKLAKAASHPPPAYDYMDAVARVYMANAMLHGTDSVTKEAVQTLMKRGLRKTADGKYTWTTDLRLRIQSPFNVVLEQAEHFASLIDRPHLLIKASDSPLYMSEVMADRILKVYQDNNPDFQYHQVEGGHHVHLNNPERIAPIVNKFLLKEFKQNGSEAKENVPPLNM